MTAPTTPTLADVYALLEQILDVVKDNQLQLRGPGLSGWPQLGQNAQGQNLTLVDAFAALVDAFAAVHAILAGRQVVDGGGA